MPSELSVIILAAGQGKRMHQAFPGVPKVLVPLAGKPMILRVLDAVEHAAVSDEIIVVIGPAVEPKVRQALDRRNVKFALQPEPKGTGHAVLCSRPIASSSKHLLVLVADQPLLSAQTIKSLVEHHLKSNSVVTMLTVQLPDFKDWRSVYADWGRVVRKSDGVFQRVVEAKDATATELHISEVNPSVYCFNAEWLWQQLPKVKCENVQSEYYLPDVLSIAVAEGAPIETIAVAEPRETLCANTPEQLSVLEQAYAQIKEKWGTPSN